MLADGGLGEVCELDEVAGDAGWVLDHVADHAVAGGVAEGFEDVDEALFVCVEGCGFHGWVSVVGVYIGIIRYTARDVKGDFGHYPSPATEVAAEGPGAAPRGHPSPYGDATDSASSTEFGTLAQSQKEELKYVFYL